MSTPQPRCGRPILAFVARTLGAVALFALLPIAIPGCAAPPPAPQDWSADYQTYAVAADHHVASQAGAAMLAAGGNAVDAAVATSFTLSVVRPFSCGIGGGGFMVISLPPTESRPAVRTTLNYRETSPARVDAMFYTRTHASSLHGGTAVAVPGTVAGLLEAHARFGTLDRATVMAPAIRAAREGFEADKAFVSAARKAASYLDEHPDDRERFVFVWERFCREGNVAVGDRIENPEQARALELIAGKGADVFYRGEIAEAIVRAVQEDGGVMTALDLANYKPRETPPLEFDYHGNRVLTMPPPSSGGIALAQIAGIYDRLISGHNPEDLTPELTAHFYAEASAHAFADRAEYLADDAFERVPTAWLISEKRLDALADRVDPDKTLDVNDYGLAAPPRTDSGTSHFSIVDARGGAVSGTETINTSFGSMLVVAEFGFCLNNEMDDFTTVPGRANAYGLVQSDKNLPAPGKRPLSSMTPTIVLDRTDIPVLLSGASGGPRIISAVAQTLLEPNPLGGTQELDQPRLHHQWIPFKVQHERSVPKQIVQSLAGRRHTVSPTGSVGVAQTIRRVRTDAGWVWRAQSDPRKGGRPAGN
ncbi:MAG: gamma-glutamyltranspeptidase/glutathione hydrolase [Phycisphaerales bacterium]|jgi:gamma-glutamyltranspeptidase/glutathione hydrolase